MHHQNPHSSTTKKDDFQFQGIFGKNATVSEQPNEVNDSPDSPDVDQIDSSRGLIKRKKPLKLDQKFDSNESFDKNDLQDIDINVDDEATQAK